MYVELMNVELWDLIKELTYAQKIECLVEKELLPEEELNDLLFNSDLTVKDLEDITG